MTAESTSLSWRSLLLIFVISLLVFTTWRWDRETWVQQQVDTLIRQQQLPIRYADMTLDGWGIQLHKLNIILPQKLPALTLDEASVHLQWSALLHGDITVRIHTHNDFLTLEAALFEHEQVLHIQDLQLQASVKPVQTWLHQPLPIQLDGELQAQGDMSLNLANGLIENGSTLSLQWSDAAFRMMQQPEKLGDYTLTLATQEQSSVQWSIQGGQSLKLQGQGQLHMQANRPQQSSLSGQVTLQAQAGTSLAQFLTTQARNIQLHGTIAQPQWQFIP